MTPSLMKLTKELTIGIIIGAILIILVGIVLVSFSPDATPSSPSATPIQPMQDALEQEYIEGCMSMDAGYAYCKCTYGYLVEAIGISGIVEMGSNYAGDAMPDEIWEAALYCADKF